MNKNIVQVLSLGVLAVVIIMVGYMLYTKNPTTLDKTSSPTTTPNPKIDTTAPDLVMLRNAPGDKKIGIAQKLAKGTDLVNLTECNSNPQVPLVSNGQQFSLVNDGPDAVTVDIASSSYKLSAGIKVALKAGFGKGQGLFGYTCSLGKKGFENFILVGP